MNVNIQHTGRYQSGFTLIEAMIAMLIFSVGLLGLAGMQMSGLQNNHKSLMRTHAIQFSYDMADSIRARIRGVIDGEDPLVDEADWNTKLADTLPSGQGRVVRNLLIPGAPIGFDITVFWDEDRTGAAGLGCDPADPADLRCITMTVVP